MRQLENPFGGKRIWETLACLGRRRGGGGNEEKRGKVKFDTIKDVCFSLSFVRSFGRSPLHRCV